MPTSALQKGAMFSITIASAERLVLKRFAKHKVIWMIDKCANPSCDRFFRYPSAGTLYVFEPRAYAAAHNGVMQEDSHSIESFWLCEQCGLTMTIVSSTGGNPLIISLLGDDYEQIGTA